MASALLASRNDPYWGEHKVYTRKNPYPNPKHCSHPNPNPNSNPIFNQIPNEHALDRQHQFHAMESDEPAAATNAASDDSSSFNRKPADLGHRRDSRGYVTFNISTYSRKELRELKRRLISELDQVRSVSSRIESRELQSSIRSVGCSTSTAYVGCREVATSVVAPAIEGPDALISRSAPKANQFYHPPEIKKQPATTGSASELMKLHTAMMKKCSQILTKLMKHKAGIWFNSPVDVVRMGLHDYHQIIKNPMDLGTVKSKLSKGFYISPLEFALDIRLTFNNALRYNPQGHDVHTFADLLLKQFEGSFGPAYAKHEKQRAAIVRQVEEEKQRMSARVVPVPDSEMKAEPALMISPPPVQTPRPHPPPRVQSQSKPQQQLPPQQAAMKMAKHLPKSKVSDPNKRAMSMEEKEKLGAAIQNLPEEKMSEVLQIVNKRNVTSQSGDEVEIDFALMDNETLWELDRYVINWRQMMSKMKKRGKIMTSGNNFQEPPSAPAPPPLPSLPSYADNKFPVAREAPEAHLAKKSKKGDPVDEDVDIGDEMPAMNYPSVEIEKESSSSSSGGDSSSSSDSDSGSSSGSDSEDSDDDARSAVVGSGTITEKLRTCSEG